MFLLSYFWSIKCNFMQFHIRFTFPTVVGFLLAPSFFIGDINLCNYYLSLFSEPDVHIRRNR